MDMETIPENIRLLVNYRRLADVLKLAIDLDIFMRLERPTTLADLSAGLGLDIQFVEYLMDALCRSGFVRADTGTDGVIVYRSTPESCRYLDSHSPLFLGRELFDDCETGTLLQGYVRNGPVSPAISGSYWSESRMKSIAASSLLGGVQSTVAMVDLSGRKSMLDVGGGHGLYSIFFTRKYPGLKATILELPQVVPIARGYIDRCGSGDSVNVIGSDYRDYLPDRPYDVVLLSNVVASLEEVQSLLSRSYGFLAKGGIVILRNYVSDTAADRWSAITRLERYTRRGIKGLTTAQLIDSMVAVGFSRVEKLGEHDGTVILRGLKE